MEHHGISATSVHVLELVKRDNAWKKRQIMVSYPQSQRRGLMLIEQFLIGDFHDVVISLLKRPVFISFFLSYFDFVIPVELRAVFN